MKYTKNLSTKQKRVLDYICQYVRDNSYSPTIEEIQGGLGFRSTRSVSQYLDALREKGYITKNRNPRSIELLNPEESFRVETFLVPLLGMASCGTPEFFADNNIEEYLPVDRAIAKHGPGEYYLLKASGNSMDLAGISSGDMVLIRRQNAYDEGDRVVAVIDEQATIKKLRKGHGAIVLAPVSSDDRHQPIISSEAAICGKVVCTVPAIS